MPRASRAVGAPRHRGDEDAGSRWARPGGLSTWRPRRCRDPSSRTIHVAAAAVPRLVFSEYSRPGRGPSPRAIRVPGRGGAATRSLARWRRAVALRKVRSGYVGAPVACARACRVGSVITSIIAFILADAAAPRRGRGVEAEVDRGLTCAPVRWRVSRPEARAFSRVFKLSRIFGHFVTLPRGPHHKNDFCEVFACELSNSRPGRRERFLASSSSLSHL